MNDRFLKACRREAVDATPIWLMRQAGRYMPEYRAIRAQHSMLDVVRNPALACDVTLQPIRAFDLDAAIIFADILTVLIGMGLHLDFAKGEGPVLDNPLASPADVNALRTPAAAENVPYTLEAIRMVRRELDGKIPLIGFSGAPFTLASYAIEGGGSKNHIKVKTFMYSHPQAWQQLMEKLVQVIAEYLIAQAEAGAQALQIFDSWAGILAVNDYRDSVLPHVQRVVSQVRAQTDVPIIYFGTDLNAMLSTIAEIPADVLGMDWRVRIDEAWEQVGEGFAVQGNLDPVALFAPWSEVQQRADDILVRVNGRAGHIFNLGHGILPETPVDNVKRLVDYVHEKSSITAKERI
jgi:uroporphyrinogen decarboxylase